MKFRYVHFHSFVLQSFFFTWCHPINDDDSTFQLSSTGNEYSFNFSDKTIGNLWIGTFVGSQVSLEVQNNQPEVWCLATD